MMTNKECCDSLKVLIVKSLYLEDLDPLSIADNSPLFGDDGLGLDSIDTVELVVLIEKNYGVKITNSDEARAVFVTVGTLAAYILEKRK